MLALKSSLKGLINVQNYTPKKLKDLCIMKSVPISHLIKRKHGCLEAIELIYYTPYIHLSL